jgi:hypothetical protein
VRDGYKQLSPRTVSARLVDVMFHAFEKDFMGAANEKDKEYDFYK